jgi:hypothetical protein
MTDNIETSSKGILHMIVSDKIQQIAFSSGVLSYHECFLSDVNFEGQYSYNNGPPQNNSIYGDGQNYSLQNFVVRRDELANSENRKSSLKK